jgi:dTDP-N-acetylfucosamine:lipid II N-acetylfucosaminyltransferase
MRILHRFPISEGKFNTFFHLTFNLPELENILVDSLAEAQNINENYDVLMIHYLNVQDIDFLNKNKITIPMIWFFWGAEFFNGGFLEPLFLLPKTKTLKKQLTRFQGAKNKVAYQIKEWFPQVRKHTLFARKQLKIVNRFDYIVPVMPGDYHILKKYYHIKPKLHHLNYVNPITTEKDISFVGGQNILLANSASYPCNHLEAIDQLKRIDLGKRKVIIPLNYGDEKYAKEMEKYALKILGFDKVVILKEFLPFDEYTEILKSCSIMVLNHIRQQGVGNVVSALCQGAHVYLRSNSTTYSYLKEYGFRISAFDNATSLENLKPQSQEHNRTLALKIFGAELQHERLKHLLLKLF